MRNVNIRTITETTTTLSKNSIRKPPPGTQKNISGTTCTHLQSNRAVRCKIPCKTKKLLPVSSRTVQTKLTFGIGRSTGTTNITSTATTTTQSTVATTQSPLNLQRTTGSTTPLLHKQIGKKNPRTLTTTLHSKTTDDISERPSTIATSTPQPNPFAKYAFTPKKPP